MNLTKALSLLVFFLFPAFLSAAQPEIAAKLGKVAATLTAAYNGSGGAVKPRTAVFTFSSSKELEKQRVGFAVSEILSHQLAKGGAFQLVERTELSSVLHELKLNFSGVTTQEDALKAGQLASAELLVLGSVEKLGQTYHVNARLVKTESGEVLATAYESMGVAVFEKEAVNYLVLVPETQAIGIYFMTGRRATAAVAQDTRIDSGITRAAVPERTGLWVPGFGIRYTPLKNFILDVSYASTGHTEKTGRIEITDNSGNTTYYKDASKFTFLRLVVGPSGKLSKKLTYYFGAGATSVRIAGDGSATYITPTLFTRLEYHPQKRIGLSLSAGYDLTTKTAHESEWMGFGLEEYETTRLSHFYFEPSVSVYF